jgi:hypothetical protein
MAKQTPTILLNEIQLGTVTGLKSAANEKGVIDAETIDGYKQNVIGALVRRNVLREMARGRYKLTRVSVASKFATA